MDREVPRPSVEMQVPLLDISGENSELHNELSAAFESVLASGRFVLGPEVTALEAEIAELCGVESAVGCASGSDALLLSLMAHGIGAGDEVIIPSFTFFATASAVTRLGARPVFADIDPESFNITAKTIEPMIGPQTRAIIPVHLFGQASEMNEINSLALSHELIVIEDAAQAIGCQYHGKAVGSLGDLACFSFYPTKNLGGFGDAGMITTNNPELAEHLRRLRNHGMEPRYYHDEVGINSRLDSIQAAMLRVKLAHLDSWTKQRQTNAARYEALFCEMDLSSRLQLPSSGSPESHVWNQYTIRVPQSTSTDRAKLRAHLSQRNIGTEIYYPVPMHNQECFSALQTTDDQLPETARAAEEVLSLPIHARLTADQQRYVVECIAEHLTVGLQSAA